MRNANALPPRTLKATGLACRRGERLLFSGIDLELGAGEMLLLRGPNGSGKTTMLMAMAGLLRPAEGRIEITGRADDEEDEEAMHLLGHLPAVSGRLTVAENLVFWIDLLGGERARTAEALDAVGLAAIAELEAGHLSAGQTRRLALARLLCADRPVWLLDEPTAALDRAGEQLVLGLIDAHLHRGGLVVAATHHDLPLHGSARVHTMRFGA